MIETLLDFSGLEDISRDLQLLSGAENNRVLREATRAGANVLKEEVVSRAPVRRGKLLGARSVRPGNHGSVTTSCAEWSMA